MAVYPIHLEPLTSYYGDDPKRMRKADKEFDNAERIAEYINKQCEERKGMVRILYQNVAGALRIDLEKVTLYLMRQGGSDNAIDVEWPEK